MFFAELLQVIVEDIPISDRHDDDQVVLVPGAASLADRAAHHGIQRVLVEADVLGEQPDDFVLHYLSDEHPTVLRGHFDREQHAFGVHDERLFCFFVRHLNVLSCQPRSVGNMTVERRVTEADNT